MIRPNQLIAALTIALALAGCEEASGDAQLSPSSNPTSIDDGEAAKPASDTATTEQDEAAARKFVDKVFGAYSSDEDFDYINEPHPIFEEQLANKMVVLAREAQELGTVADALGADPVCSCQDFMAFSHMIDAVDIDEDRATILLTVFNFGESETRWLDLIKTDEGWRIYDIDGQFRASVLEG